MPTIHAVFENGVFRPTHHVELPESSEVEFEPRVLNQSEDPIHRQRVQEFLAARFNSGQSEISARHNEHQP